MTSNTETQVEEQVKAILPEDATQATNSLIRLTKSLCLMADREASAIAHDDMMALAILQDEKAKLAGQYMQACEEFRDRIEEFRSVDTALIGRLEKLQKELGERAHSNNESAEQLYNNAKTRTQSSLLAAQEIGQSVHVRYPEAQEAVNENEQQQ
ncbi:MAG: hypothetical protein JKY71_11965 [Alphaproteobacteria bacterium]|nr:hypothetical protein [Alphaproteobacteria bacterium]